MAEGPIIMDDNGSNKKGGKGPKGKFTIRKKDLIGINQDMHELKEAKQHEISNAQMSKLTFTRGRTKITCDSPTAVTITVTEDAANAGTSQVSFSVDNDNGTKKVVVTSPEKLVEENSKEYSTPNNAIITGLQADQFSATFNANGDNAKVTIDFRFF